MSATSDADTVPVSSLQAQLQRDLESIRRVAAKVESLLLTDKHNDQTNRPKGNQS